jgi:hypothetical protein
VRLATGNEADEKLLMMLCQRVERLLRMALSDWHGYLSREALNVDTWRYGVPWWVKRVPDRFDLSWAMNDLQQSVGSKGMLLALYTSVDETVLSMKRDEEMLNNPPKIDLLYEALKELCDVVGV